MSLATAVALFGALFLAVIHVRRHLNDRKMPPGPWAFPIIGNLHMLGRNPHESLRRLAQKYGPIMTMRLGQVTTIVVTSPEASELIYKTHDAVFAGRPKIQVGEYVSCGYKAVALTEYGSYWRSVRRLCTLKLLSPAKIESFVGMRTEEMGSIVKGLNEAAAAREVVNLTEKVGEVLENMTCRMIIGRKNDEKFKLKKVIEETTHAVGALNVGEFIPYLRPFDLQGIIRKIKQTTKEFDMILEIIIDEHIEKHDKGKVEQKSGDFVDELLSMMGKPIDSNNNTLHVMDRSNIRAILRDLITAGIGTSTTTIDWIMAELLRHPRVIRELQNELKSFVGMERMVEETDLPKLAYLDMVVKEGLRLHPPGPLLVPHESLEDIWINGYFIPKKSRIIVNAWAIGRDPNIWTENVDEFFPERFRKDTVDVQGRDFRLLPFGSGRRGCPGARLAILEVGLVVAQLVHCFDWELAGGMLPSDVDMTDKLGGLAVMRANDLLALPSYRLK